nr:hypothetical protein [Clostridia bacterium]
MKRLIALLVIICMLLSFVGCQVASPNNPDTGDDTTLGGENGVENNGDGGDSGETGGGSGDNSGDSSHTYNDFTADEKTYISDTVGFLIPFIPCDEYYVEEYSYEEEYYAELGFNFCAFGSTPAEFEKYLELFDQYNFDYTKKAEDGNTWYFYSSGEILIDLTHYYYEGKYVMDLYAYFIPLDEGSDSGNTGGSGDGGNTGEGALADEWREQYDTITVEDAFAICDASGSTKSERYYLIATVISVEDDYYGKMMIEDSTGELLVYGSYGADGEQRYGDLTDAVPKEGDVVLFYGNFMMYNGTREMYSGWIIDFYTPGESGSGNTGSGDSGNTGGGSGDNSGDGSHAYNDFTADEKTYISDTVGFLIPFIPCDEYYVEEYSYEEYGYAEWGFNYYTFGSTPAEFEKYLELFDQYTFDYTEKDEDGDTWYYYFSGEVLIDLTHYYYEGEYVMDLYAYFVSEDESGSGNTGSGDSGNTGSGSGDSADIITNLGAGLPTGTNGVFNIDFTKGEYVKDVTDQGYYLDGCPTMGSPAVLVIPVEFSDSLATSKGYTVDALKNAFEKDGVNDYYSVYDYYYISSYGQLTLDIEVLDFWFKPEYDSDYYYNARYDYYGEQIEIGDQLVLDEALSYLEGIMDLSRFDSDNNGYIDAVVLVNTLDIGDENFYWAYRYWNVYTEDGENYYEYDAVSANDYIWASYQFLLESYDEEGNSVYNPDTMNTYTFIHEFAHVLGADDYYDTEYETEPMAGCDIMDSLLGDHNAFTKFNLGWITSSRLVVADESVTLSLEDFSKSGDTIILACNWDERLGAYQEYYVLAYYRNVGLNDNELGYFSRDGVVVYHVNASLYSEEVEGEIYYDIYNNNTSPTTDYGTEDNLIEYVKSSLDTYTYAEGDTLPEVTDDEGNRLGYTFVVDSLTEDCATITFSVIP